MLIDFGLTSGCLVCLGGKVTFRVASKDIFWRGKKQQASQICWRQHPVHLLRYTFLDFGNFRPMKGNPKQSWIQDFMQWIPYSMPGTGFQSLSMKLGFWILQSLVEFRIPWAVFRIPKPSISTSTSKISRIPESGFHYMFGFWQGEYSNHGVQLSWFLELVACFGLQPARLR